jgi:hypothetical protein
MAVSETYSCGGVWAMELYELLTSASPSPPVPPPLPPPPSPFDPSPLSPPLRLTTCGNSGPYQPSLDLCKSAYRDQPALSSLSMSTPFPSEPSVWQTIIIERSGLYNITAAGAAGIGGTYNDQCRGAVLSVVVQLPANNILFVMVGQVGHVTGEPGNINGDGGAGGGTFVLSASGDPLLISGGGGGFGNFPQPKIYASCDASLNSTSGQQSADGTPGGSNGTAGAGIWSGGGLYSGAQGITGTSAMAGGYGGVPFNFDYGGFGGGGQVGGGGGGYSGGGSTQTCCVSAGGGGGSFCANSSFSQCALGYNAGDGFVIVAELKA